MNQTETCPTCGGKIKAYMKVCPTCNGTGRISQDETWGKHRNRGDGFTHHADDDCHPDNQKSPAEAVKHPKPGDYPIDKFQGNEADTVILDEAHGLPDPSEAEGDDLWTLLSYFLGQFRHTQRPGFDIATEAHAALTAWHTKQVMEIIGEDEPFEPGDYENRKRGHRNALRAEQQAKLKEAQP